MARNAAMIFDRCFKSVTSRSISISKKSSDRLVNLRLVAVLLALLIALFSLRVRAIFFGDHQMQPSGKGRLLPFVVVPRNIHPTFRRILKRLQGIAVNRVNGHPLAGGYNANDAISGQRMTAASEMKRHAGDQAANGNREILPLVAAGFFSVPDRPFSVSVAPSCRKARSRICLPRLTNCSRCS